MVDSMNDLPVDADAIARETRKDANLGKILQLLQDGENLVSHDYKAPEAYYSLSSNCIIFEHRVFVPTTLRQSILKELHAPHLGVARMKGIARAFVYWPGIDADINEESKSCAGCAVAALLPVEYQTHDWEYPKGPWERVHIGYVEVLLSDSTLLVVFDVYSKWIEVKFMHSISMSSTIAFLEKLFATYGVPITIETDNTETLVENEFKTFLHNSGVKYHELVARYDPASHIEAPRYVDRIKSVLIMMTAGLTDFNRDFNVFLQYYRNAPLSMTGETPALLFLGRNLRTRLDLVRRESKYEKVSEKQNSNFDSTFKTFAPSQKVYFLLDDPQMDKWVPGTIITRLGDLFYKIVHGNKLFERHIDHIVATDRKKDIQKEAPSIPRIAARPSTSRVEVPLATFHQQKQKLPTELRYSLRSKKPRKIYKSS